MTNEQIINAGYTAHVMGKDMVRDNPYANGTPEYWLWRQGFIEAHQDSN